MPPPRFACEDIGEVVLSGHAVHVQRSFCPVQGVLSNIKQLRNGYGHQGGAWLSMELF